MDNGRPARDADRRIGLPGVNEVGSGEPRRRGRRPKQIIGEGARLDLARDLTKLLDARGMTRSELARRLHYRNTTVSEVFGGTKMPSEKLLTAIVKELGEDPAPWLERRDLIENQECTSTRPDGPWQPASSLVGRAAEIERVETLVVAAAAGHSGVLVVRGEPGVGKSALLTAASAPGMLPLSMRCVESEVELAFSTLSGLLRPVAHLMPRLPGPQRRALEVSLALAAPQHGEPPPGSVAIGLGVLGILSEAAPAVMVLDDAQWMDEASALALSFAIRRLAGEGVAVVVAVRSGAPCPMDLTGYPTLDVTGLARGAAAELAGRFRNRPVSTAELDWLMCHTNGNPLALGELCRSGRPLGETADDGPPPALPEVLAISFQRRLEPLPPATRWALLICAAGYTSDLAQLTRALGQDGLADLEPAETAGLLTVADSRVEFAHPLIRAAVYHAATPARRRAAHAHLAQAQNGGSAAAADQRAWHLAEAALGTDEDAARILCAAGERARRRGALTAACSAYRRAAGLTPLPETRAHRLLTAATCAYLAGWPDRALPLLDQARSLTTEPGLVGEIGYIRNQIRQLRAAPREVFAELTAAAAKLREQAPEAAVDMYATAASAAILGGLIPQAVAAAGDGHALARAATGSDRVASMVMWMAALTMSGRSAEAIEVFHREGHRLFEADPLEHGTEVFGFAALCLMWLNEHAAAYRLMETALQRFSAVNALERVANLATALAELNFRRGRWNAAYATAARALALADAQDQVAISGYAAYTLARIEAGQGQSRRCREYSERAQPLLDAFEHTGVSLYVALPLAELALNQGDHACAAERFLRLDARMHALEVRNGALLLHHSGLVEACVNAGRRREAQEALDRLIDEAGPSPQDSVHASLEHCRGLLATDPDLALEHFTRAIELYGRCVDPYSLARTQFSCADLLTRASRDATLAREYLEEARHSFLRLRAYPWLRRTERALGLPDRCRATRHAFARLTAQEVQVARLVADGAAISEAAESLFLSTQTVEARLAAARSRMRTSSNAELTELLRDADQDW
ncbi:AAA family ATPase [Microtetraspora malaysiensis]|uniref:AAA family ATPase n=1 Tax=Microtetraspora malaysiensis TaxID=161358 RepID=UPI003D92F8E7